MENDFDILKSSSNILKDWHTRDYIRSNSVESQYLSPNHDASSITFYSNQLYYEIFTLENMCPFRLPLPKTEQEFLSDLNRTNIKIHKSIGDQNVQYTSSRSIRF